MRAFAQRWRARGRDSRPATLRYMADHVQPTARVDRDWDPNDKLIFGYSGLASTQIPVPGPNREYPAVAVFSGSREVLILRAAFSQRYEPSQDWLAWGAANMLTPDDSYNPVEFGANLMFPGLNTNPDSSFFVLPQAFVVQGYQTSLYAATIGGYVVDPIVGPTRFNNFWQEKHEDFIQPQDPPIVLPPRRIWAMQCHYVRPAPNAGEYMEWSIWLSEREAA